jgi:hypothetical protein
MSGKMPLISTGKKPNYQVVPRTLESSPYLEAPVNLIRNINSNGRKKHGTSNNNAYRLKPNMDFGRREERSTGNAELRRLGTISTNNTRDRFPYDPSDHDFKEEGLKFTKNKNNNKGKKGKMILLPFEVDELIEKLGIVDDSASMMSKKFGTVEIPPDDGSVGSDCLLETFCDDDRSGNEVQTIHFLPERNFAEHKDEVLSTLPELSSTRSGKTSKGSDCSRNHKGRQQVGNTPLPSDVLVLPRIEQGAGAVIRNENTIVNTETSQSTFSTNSKEHPILKGDAFEDNSVNSYNDEIFEAGEEEEEDEEEEEVYLDRFETVDEESQIVTARKNDPNSLEELSYDDDVEEEEIMFQQRQRQKYRI